MPIPRRAEGAAMPGPFAYICALTQCLRQWRAQAVEVAPGDPHLFWSGAEDSEVRQYDTRCRCVVLVRLDAFHAFAMEVWRPAQSAQADIWAWVLAALTLRGIERAPTC